MTDLGSYNFQSDDLATLAQKASGKKVASSDDSIDTQIKAATKNTAEAIKLRDAEVNDPGLKQRQADDLRQSDEDTKRRTSAYDSFAAASKDLENFKPPPTQKETDPLQSFGSLGSVFGILASAFTHQPWQNTMNAAASAMNAVKANDRTAYEESYKAWKDNLDLMFKRHTLMKDDYDAAAELAADNQSAGAAAYKLAAAKFSDPIAAHLADADDQEKLAELMDRRNHTALEMEKLKPEIAIANGVAQTKWDILDAQKRGDQQGVADGMARLKVLQDKGDQRSSIPTMSQEESKAVQALVDRGVPIDKAVAQVQNKGGMTGNERIKLESNVDLIDNSLGKIDEAVDALNAHIGAAGVAGRATRMGEVVGNIFGSSETDRAQFRRNIEYLQALGSKLLTDSAGRPLAGTATKIYDVIGGLNLGDTTANTLRSLEEVKDLYTKQRASTLSELNGNWQPGGAPADGAPAPTKPKSAQPWLDDPEVK